MPTYMAFTFKLVINRLNCKNNESWKVWRNITYISVLSKVFLDSLLETDEFFQESKGIFMQFSVVELNSAVFRQFT